MPHLYGSRIMLREYRNEDLNPISAWVNDVDTVHYLSSRYWTPQSIANTADFLDHAARSVGSSACFVIADKTDQRYLGQIDLTSINWKLRSAELAMVMGGKSLRGKGYGAEALGLMLPYAFQTLGLERVELEVAQENLPAIRCYERAGFVTEGVKRHAFFVDGHFSDLRIMAVLADEWRAAHGASAE